MGLSAQSYSRAHPEPTKFSPIMVNDAPTPEPRRASSPPSFPYLPTSTETFVFAAYPALLLFGSVFSFVSPETRAAPYDPIAQAHAQDPALAPSYFARKSNLINQVFVKKGWAWMTAAFVAFALTHRTFSLQSANGGGRTRRIKAFVRFGLVTIFWIFVTQWFFGPPLIDRGFRITGGRCDAALTNLGEDGSEQASLEDVWTAMACKAAGGKWKGGHDISGHVFLLVLGSGALLQEVGWVLWKSFGANSEERHIVMPDGTVKTASVESLNQWNQQMSRDFGVSTKFAAGIVALSGWMLLMTAIYFHTWFEKVNILLILPSYPNTAKFLILLCSFPYMTNKI